MDLLPTTWADGATFGIPYQATEPATGLGWPQTSYTVAQVLNETLSAARFGAKGDKVADDTIPLQRAIDTCIASGARRPRLLIHGRHRITAPLVIARKNPGGTDYDFATGLSIVGANSSMYGGTEYGFYPDYSDGPAIAIHFGRAIHMQHLVFVGKNGIAYQTANQMTNSANFLAPGVRDNPLSPHCAVAIDAFYGSGIAGSDKYPALTSWYVGATPGGTSWSTFDDCHFIQFACGVAISPGPTGPQNAENIAFRRCQFESATVGLAIGQRQSRNVNLDDCTFLNLNWLFSGGKYGPRTGVMPNIHRGTANLIHYLFDAPNCGYGAAAIDGLYTENLLSLGYLYTGAVTGDPIAFTGCQFNFIPSNPTVQTHGWIQTPTTWQGCKFNTTDDGVGHPLSLWCGLQGNGLWWPPVFQACNILTTLTQESPQFVVPRANAFYAIGSSIQERANDRTPFSHEVTSDTLARLDRRSLPPGARVQVIGATADYRVKAEMPIVPLSLTGLAFDGNGGGTATINAASVGLVRTGDMLVDASFPGVIGETFPNGTAPTAANCYVARVATIVGAVMTLADCVKGADGTHTMAVTWIPRFHGACVGDVANGTATILNVTNPGAYAVGDRVRAIGLDDGTYITAIAGTQFDTSRNATVTTVATRLSDADVRTVATAAL